MDSLESARRDFVPTVFLVHVLNKFLMDAKKSIIHFESDTEPYLLLAVNAKMTEKTDFHFKLNEMFEKKEEIAERRCQMLY